MRRCFALICLLAIPAAMAAFAANRLRQAPKVEPPFESIVDVGAGPIRSFALRDARGAVHTMDEWTNRRAIVLLFLKGAHQESIRAGRDTAHLAAVFDRAAFPSSAFVATPRQAPRIQAIWVRRSGRPFRSSTTRSNSSRGRPASAPFPRRCSLHPTGRCSTVAGCRLAASGRDTTKTTPDGYDLERALWSIDHDELPELLSTAAAGSPLSPALFTAEPEPEPTAPITFTRHVAPILWKNRTVATARAKSRRSRCLATGTPPSAPVSSTN